jgi:hypothetical protein
MILPMMGFIFALTAAGAAWVVASSAIRRFRSLRPFALVPLGAALLAFSACWALAISLEAAFGEPAGGTGFFAGYAVGGLAGAPRLRCCAAPAAPRRLIRRLQWVALPMRRLSWTCDIRTLVRPLPIIRWFSANLEAP